MKMKIIQITLDSIDTIDEGLHVVVALFLACVKKYNFISNLDSNYNCIANYLIVKKYNIISNLDISNH